MVVGLANGSRSANKSIHADAFLSIFIFDLLVTPFLLASDDEADAAVEPWIFFKKSNAERFDDDDDDDDEVCADAIGLQLLAALLKMSNKQSVSVGSFVEMSNRSRIIESLTLVFVSLVALSAVSAFDCVVSSSFCFAVFSFDESSFCDALTSSSKSSCKWSREKKCDKFCRNG